MDKIFTMKYDSSIIECLSDDISRFISSIEDKCDGVFTVCYERRKGKLRSVSLCIVSSNLELIKLVNGKRLECDACNVNVIGIPSMCFLGVKSELPVDRLLKSGVILYDVDGSLHGIKKNLDNSKNIETLRTHGVIRTKPPIQYIKKA